MPGSNLPVVLLMGPTGAGKTAVAIELAARLPAEIVSIDSALVYRGLDIGTAKPDAAMRAQVPHHLIDILDPAQPYSAGQCVRDAVVAIDAIQARGRIPLLTGGTMLYFHALLHGLAELPEADPDLRRELDERAAREGTAALHAELARVDPQAAARIHPNDPQRIQRALEVFRLTGQPISELQASQRVPLADRNVVEVVLSPARRAVLHQRIEARFHAMMTAGFLEEVRDLRARGDLDAHTPSMRAVGYRQLWAHLDGAYGLEEAVRRGIVATRRLAKRQLTWLRALPGARWVEPTDNSAVDFIAGLVKESSNPNPA
ncbi:MAG TPA: tRNA (adenosine(37)-N6)-dimethylallyltransferase MiaA [Steroidobacteraceae bacterium]|nr:tRNA (adenosine(37)-N6)-dimethylallyltransferase MiaA [Steroidobacteraceae bacterium]